MYEIGDKVIYQGADKSAYKRRGVVASIEKKDGKPQLTVAFGDGEEFTAPIDDWSRAFTNAAKNAKFKVGDFVKELASGRTWRVGEIDRDTVELWQWPGFGRTRTMIREVEDTNRFVPAPKVAEEWKKAQANSRACNSTNATVANALNARTAKNATAKNASYSLDDVEKINGYARMAIELIGKLRKDIHAAYRVQDRKDAPKDIMDWLYKIEGLFREARNSGKALWSRLYNE